MTGRVPNDMRRLLQQAQQMQAGLRQAQAELADKTYVGTAGGGVVKATVTGAGALLTVEIDPEIIDPDDAELIGDLVVAAVNQARRTAEKDAATALGGFAGGMDLGGLLG